MTGPALKNPLWTAYEAAAAASGRLYVKQQGAQREARASADDWAARGVNFDTRQLAPGDLFIAVQGARDGHEFLTEAQMAGACAALVSQIPANAPNGLPLLQVTDTMAGLKALAVAARDRNFGKFIAVTGSVGKTSTKDMLRAALNPLGDVHAAVKSFNNELGVSVSLATLPANADYGVFEIGMNHAGEITPLTALVRPHAAIITTIAAAHLENFDSIDGIAAAKAEILTGVRPGGAAILPKDSPYYDFLAGEAAKAGITRIIAFGETADGKAGARLNSYTQEGDHADIRAEILGEMHEFRALMPGKHQALNALAALAAIKAVGGDLAQAVEGLSAFVPGEGRGATQTVTLNGKRLRIFDESYNANPASMKAGIARLAGEPGRRVAVLGAMKELGPDTPALHAGLAEPLHAAGVTRLWTAGEEMQALAAAAPSIHAGHEANAIDLLEPLLADLQDGDAILFKGSNASKVGALLSAFLAKTDGAA